MKRGLSVFLLFPLLLSSTACMTWQPEPVARGAIPARVVEWVETHPSRKIRISNMAMTALVPGAPRIEVSSPSIEDDQLVGVVDGQMFSTPLSDIAMLEIRNFDLVKTVGTLGLGYLGLVAFSWVLFH
jgi:hypothetical protein